MAKSSIKLSKGDLTVELLPEFGGRISSIKVAGCEEWITQPHDELVHRSPGDNFIRPEISGWDEMVPTTARNISKLFEAKRSQIFINLDNIYYQFA